MVQRIQGLSVGFIPKLEENIKRKHNLSPYPADPVATVLGPQLVEENMFFRV